MNERRQDRLSLSLPVPLVEFVRARAAEQGTTNSAVVAAALQRLMRAERNVRIIAELTVDADEERALAEGLDHPNLGGTGRGYGHSQIREGRGG